MQIIALTGKKQSGKSTLAKHLETKGYVRVNFKDALVEELKQNFPDLLEILSLHYDMDIDTLFNRKPMFVRKLMQNYGTNVRRKDNETYWVARWVEEAIKHDRVVVDDVRFLNEAKAVKRTGEAMGGKTELIRIVRPNTEEDTHISETEMDEIKADREIINNKSIEELYKNI